MHIKKCVARLDELSKDLGGDQKLLKTLVQMFLADLPQYLQNVSFALSSGNMSDLEKNAHVLKGAALNFRSERVVSLALEMERGAREGDDLESLYPSLVQEVMSLKQYLNDFLESKESV